MKNKKVSLEDLQQSSCISILDKSQTHMLKGGEDAIEAQIELNPDLNTSDGFSWTWGKMPAFKTKYVQIGTIG